MEIKLRKGVTIIFQDVKRFISIITKGSVHKINALAGSLAAGSSQWVLPPFPWPAPSPGRTPGRTPS